MTMNQEVCCEVLSEPLLPLGGGDLDTLQITQHHTYDKSYIRREA